MVLARKLCVRPDVCVCASVVVSKCLRGQLLPRTVPIMISDAAQSAERADVCLHLRLQNRTTKVDRYIICGKSKTINRDAGGRWCYCCFVPGPNGWGLSLAATMTTSTERVFFLLVSVMLWFALFRSLVACVRACVRAVNAHECNPIKYGETQYQTQ